MASFVGVCLNWYSLFYGGHEFLLMVGGLYSSVNSFQRRLGDFVAESNRERENERWAEREREKRLIRGRKKRTGLS